MLVPLNARLETLNSLLDSDDKDLCKIIDELEEDTL